MGRVSVGHSSWQAAHSKDHVLDEGAWKEALLRRREERLESAASSTWSLLHARRQFGVQS